MRISRRHFTLLMLAVVLPFSAFGARTKAQPSSGPGQDSGFTLEGKVTQKSQGKLTVSTEENIVFHVSYNEKTDIRLKEGAQGSDKDLKTGVKVRVEGDLSESGEILARKIEVL